MRTILLIYTGGTIGMIKDPQSGELRSFDFAYVYDHIPELARLNINLKSISFPKPIDSSEITLEHWKNLAQIIVENYEVYDGFVVLFESHFKRNYVHVKDVSRVFQHALLNHDKMKGQIYNVGLSEANVSKWELCERIQKHIQNFTFLFNISSIFFIVASLEVFFPNQIQ
mgnify:CR=1 FL=1